MALLYKVKYGYSLNPTPSTMSEIVFIDEGLYSFMEGGAEFPTYETISASGPAAAYKILGDYYGNQVNSLYLLRTKGIGQDDEVMAGSAFPSLKINAPNMYDSNMQYFVCYFPSLNSIIISYSGGSRVARVSEDGVFSFSGYQTNYGNGYVKNGAVYLLRINKYTGPDSLTNPENWFRSYFAFSGDSFLLQGESANLSKSGRQFIQYLFGSNPTPPDSTGGPINPYEPGGDSGEGGGDGTFDDDSEPIPMPSLPTLSSANTGFTRIYNPTLSQVQDLANYLWTDETVIQTIWNHIKQYFEDPMQAIIGFNLVPVPVPNGGTESFKLMYIDTGVSMTVAANQFVDVDCGTLELKGYYGSALDYSPYTKVSCYLPYIGNVSLNVDEVMNRTLQVKYRVDICSGSCVAYILVNGNAMYQYSGHCAIPIPLSSADFSSYVNSAISVGKLAGAAMIAGAGALAATEAVDAAQQTNQIVTTTKTTTTSRNPATGRQITDWTKTTVETRDAPEDQSSTQASLAGLTPQNIANTVGQIMSSKPYIEHSGSFSGNSGYLGVRRPYVIIERPNMCMPANFQALNGFPSMITLLLGECSGFTRIQQVQLTGMTATNPEQAEILQLLKSGVIL